MGRYYWLIENFLFGFYCIYIIFINSLCLPLPDKNKHFVNLGLKIKKIRKENGLTQDELSRQMGVSKIHLCGMETGKRAVTLDVMEKVAAATGTRLVVVFDCD